jgi:hypothetical protein
VLHALLCLAPALALGLLLLARRYPGERALVAMRRRERPRLPRAERSLPNGAREVTMVVRGGLLIGSSLAVRPPPALRAAS